MKNKYSKGVTRSSRGHGGMSTRAVAFVLSISETRVRQIERKALDKIKSHPKKDLIIELLRSVG